MFRFAEVPVVTGIMLQYSELSLGSITKRKAITVLSTMNYSHVIRHSLCLSSLRKPKLLGIMAAKEKELKQREQSGEVIAMHFSNNLYGSKY